MGFLFSKEKVFTIPVNPDSQASSWIHTESIEKELRLLRTESKNDGLRKKKSKSRKRRKK